jgi:pilus assembly protein Flp/PilA
MRNILKRFVADESGATAIEYGLIAAGIFAGYHRSVNGIGKSLSTSFGQINTSLK